MDSPDVVVRRASRSDADLVLSTPDLLPAPPTAEWTRDFLDRGANVLLLALLNDLPVGLLIAVETSHLGTGPDLFVYDIHVHPDHRGRGIAHRLVDKAAMLAEEAGYTRLWGATRPDDEPGPAPGSPAGGATFTIPLP